ALRVEADEEAEARAMLRGNDSDVERHVEISDPRRHARSEGDAHSCSGRVWACRNLNATGCAEAHQPGQARNEEALIDAANQRDPLGHRSATSVAAHKALLELPAELADYRIDVASELFLDLR